MKTMNTTYAPATSRFTRSNPIAPVPTQVDDDIPSTAENLMLAGAVAHYLRTTFMLNSN